MSIQGFSEFENKKMMNKTVKSEYGGAAKLESESIPIEKHSAAASDYTCNIGEAQYPSPFKAGLEFNPPVHGTWNIVHIGMQVPETHQIYVCAINCMRGVVLTAAEMGAMDRFSCVVLEEKDILLGRVEEITIQGTIDVLRRMPKLPRAVMLFTVCTHHFLGCDLNRIYRELEKAFPQVIFYRCFMDPIMQKEGLSPDQKLRVEMLRHIPELPIVPKQVAILGGDFQVTGDLVSLLTQRGYSVVQLQDCRTYADYEALGQSAAFICTYPNGKIAVERLGKRLKQPALYLPSCFTDTEIDVELYQLSDLPRCLSVSTIINDVKYNNGAANKEAVNEEMAQSGVIEHRSINSDMMSYGALEETLNKFNGTASSYLYTINKLRKSAKAALECTRTLIGNTPIAIDGTVHPRPLGLARLLISHGMNVQRVYLDAISSEEKTDFDWLRANASALEMMAITRPIMRVLPRATEKDWLAIGQKAAWFCQTKHFVNMVQGGGLWGYSGIREMAELIADAYTNEKDTEDIVPRKGLGCQSCI